MQNTINIIVSVDVIKALSDKALTNSIYLMDDSSFSSNGKGTAELVTRCVAGQTIRWSCYPIDLQTPLAISRIDFLPATGEKLPPPVSYPPQTGASFPANNPNLLEWAGIVPYYLVPNQIYHYRLHLEMGEGKYSEMYIDTVAIMIQPTLVNS